MNTGDKPSGEAASLRRQLIEQLDHAIDEFYCQRSNDGGYLAGNTQASDLEWIADNLFSGSKLFTADVYTLRWALTNEEWELLGFTPIALMGDGPRRFDQLSEEQRSAWLKLARIVMYMMPRFAERIGNRWMLQAKAAHAAWKEVASQEQRNLKK